jgi:hypothetical protein
MTILSNPLELLFIEVGQTFRSAKRNARLKPCPTKFLRNDIFSFSHHEPKENADIGFSWHTTNAPRYRRGSKGRYISLPLSIGYLRDYSSSISIYI